MYDPGLNAAAGAAVWRPQLAARQSRRGHAGLLPELGALNVEDLGQPQSRRIDRTGPRPSSATGLPAVDALPPTGGRPARLGGRPAPGRGPVPEHAAADRLVGISADGRRVADDRHAARVGDGPERRLAVHAARAGPILRARAVGGTFCSRGLGPRFSPKTGLAEGATANQPSPRLSTPPRPTRRRQPAS